MSDDEVFAAVRHSIAAAREKHPVWPLDRIHGAAIVGEEAGELLQATLQAHYEKGYVPKCKMEAFHVIVTAVRFITET